MLLTDPVTWLLALTALVTAAISAVVGMAGGVTLLSVLLLFLDPLEAIPLHGVVQLVSNGSRAWIQRRHVRARVVAPYSVLLLPMAFVGYLVARGIPPNGLQAAIGVFILLATWTPSLFSLPMGATRGRPGLVLLGAVAGFLQTTVGAVGPMLAPFFLRLDLDRFGLIGNKAACQLMGHLVKLVVFGTVGFAFTGYLPLLGLLVVSVTIGTIAGSRLLSRLDERAFRWVYKTVLSLVAVRLALQPIVPGL